MKNEAQHKFLIWLHYNGPRLDNLADKGCNENIIQKYKKAMKVKSKYCACKEFKGKEVNSYWEDWHCTYCLKPIKK